MSGTEFFSRDGRQPEAQEFFTPDDTTLLAARVPATVPKLQKMVNIYVMENEKLDLSINVTKSRCFCVGRKFKS